MTDQFTPLALVACSSADQVFAGDAASPLQELEGKKPSRYTDSNGIPAMCIGERP